MSNVFLKVLCIFLPFILVAGCFLMVNGVDLNNYSIETIKALIENAPRISFRFDFSYWLSEILGHLDDYVNDDILSWFINLNVDFVSKMGMITDFLFNSVIDFVNMLSFIFYFINFIMSGNIVLQPS